MLNKTLYLLLLILLPGIVTAQKIDNLVSFRDMNSERYFRFTYENDYFAASDENYTQGYNLELVFPALQKNPANFLFFKPKEAFFRYGISVEHIGYTPHDYVSTEIQFGDRPFASAIMLKSFTIVTDTIKKTRLSQSLSLGLIGPGAFGKEMQVEIHRATGNKIPGGWDNQIKNDVVLNYRIDHEKQVLHYSNIFALQTNATLQLGTLFTHATVGINTTIGLLDAPFSAVGKRNAFQLYAYAQPLVSVIGYDATLQGGLLNRKSVYTIASKDMERFTSHFHYGIVLKTRTLYFEYARSNITREFETGNSAKWGGIKIGFTI
ncbi:MAG: lipid A deacylase LpxR family protein [Flavobacteriales bacterium]|nr:lipid A deacylase LpxR family protein [Flavobacteriales bacterium]